MMAKRRLLGHEHALCGCCGNTRWGDVAETVFEADGATYCDEVCARDRGAVGPVVIEEERPVLPHTVSWENEIRYALEITCY